MSEKTHYSGSEWVHSTIDEVCIIEYGTRVTRKRDAGTIYPVYGGGGATFQMDSYNRENRMLVSRFAMSETCTRFVEGKFFLNDSGLTLRPKDDCEILPIFLDWLIHSLNDEIYSLGRGTAQKNLNMNEFRELSIHYPKDISEQKRIVSIIDEAFNKISKSTEAMDDNLRNTLNFLISTREQCFTPRPHWLQSQLDDLCNIKHGFAFKSQFFSQLGDFVLLTPGNFFETGGYRDRGEKQKFYTGEIPEGYILEKGDLLVAMTEQAAGLLGSPIIVPEGDRFLHNQRLGLINWNGSQTMSNEFVYHFFNTHTVRQELHNTGTGIKVRHTSPTKIGNLKIAIPPTIEEQQEIADKLNSIEQEVSNLGLLYENKTAIMSQLKQSILQEAFNGNLTKEITA